MEDFIRYLRQFGTLTAEDIRHIEAHTRSVDVPKGGRLMEAAKIPKELWFIVEGITRIYYYTEAGKEVTKYFVDEGNISTDGSSYLYGLPTMAYVETITDCRLLCITRSAFDELGKHVADWDALFLRLLAHGMTEKVNRISPMLSESAEERYLNFTERFPELHNRIPLNYLASYIGVTKSSLSRIRRNLVPVHEGRGTDN